MNQLPASWPTDFRIENILTAALSNNSLNPSRPLAFFFDLDSLTQTLAQLSIAFPPPALNAIAVKANPIVNILKIPALKGFGAECASLGEILIAKKAGFPQHKILYDSPVKSHDELNFALDEGLHVNLDNDVDLARTEDRLTSAPDLECNLGIRFNPQIRAGRYSVTSTASRYSKFGMTRSEILRAIKTHSHIKKRLIALHCHIGSQGFDPSLLTDGIKRLALLAKQLNTKFGCRINSLDIGGGLPVRYQAGDHAMSFLEYSNGLKKSVPELQDYRLMTEFGRSVMASAGFAVSRVEAVKRVSGRKIALIHAGADLFLRSAYMNWHHDIDVRDSKGFRKDAPEFEYDIGGPLCFSGDFLARKRLLPQIEEGDWLIVRDAGAYTFSMWSIYNSRAFPPIYGYGDSTGLIVLHAGVASERIVDFW